MALASQAPRGTNFRGGSTRNQRKTVITAVAALAVLAGGTSLVVLLISRSGTAPGEPVAGTPAANPAGRTAGRLATDPQPAPAATPTPAATTQTPAPTAAPALTEPARPVTTAPAPQAPASRDAVIPGGTPSPTPGASAPTTPTAAAPSLPPAPMAPLDATSGLPSDLTDLIRAGATLQGQGNLLEARTKLNTALLDRRLPAPEREALRRQIASLNESLVFSPTLAPGDPLFGTYTVLPGDNITKIMRSQAPFVDRLFLGRINNMADVNKLSVGRKIKVPRQPFHLIVHKDSFRADLYMGPPLPPDATISDAQPIEARLTGWTYIRSFAVGLGESNGTPEGLFGVRPSSKLINPEWINPRDRTRFAANDPANPIGEHWIGLEGAEEKTRTFAAYGMHGTIQPDSIGKQMSMGCVRMLAADIALVYEVMAEKVSHVWIVR